MAEAASSFRGAGVWRWREVGADDPTMVAVLRESAAVLPPGPLLARVLASLSMELTHEWCSPEAAAIAERAIDMARPIGDTELFADVVAMRMLVLWGRPGAAAERLALAAEVLRLPLSQEQELYARFGAAAAHLQHGDPAAADREMTRCTELARRLRHTGADIPIAWWRFYRVVASGNDALVARLSDENIERHRRSQIVALPEIETMAQLQRAGLGEPTPDGLWHYTSMYADCLRVDVLIGRGCEALGDIEGARGAYLEAVDRNRALQLVPWLRRAQQLSALPALAAT